MTQLFVVGIDHHTAPVEVREQLALRAADLPAALAALTSGPSAPLGAAVILSTCNRVEIYGVAADETAADTVIAWLHERQGLPRDLHRARFRTAWGGAAVAHLFTTTAGLNSLVVGEPQVQGQVRAAHQLAAEARASGPLLHALFRHALEAGKRVRTETGIDRHAVSVSHAGVELARQLLGGLADARILLVGSGKMSELAAKNLLDNGARSITMVNRTVERAEQLARTWGGQVRGWDHLAAAIAEADVVISSTAAPHTVIHAEHVAAAVVGRTTPLILIDLAVPRDIEPAAGDVPGAFVYNIDDLQAVVSGNLARRHDEISGATAIVAAEVERFMGWLQGRTVLPTLNHLREQAELIRQNELAKALRRLGPLDDRDRQIVEALSMGIVNKLLHQPTVRLKHAASQGEGGTYAAALQTLFGLAGGEGGV